MSELNKGYLEMTAIYLLITYVDLAYHAALQFCD